MSLCLEHVALSGPTLYFIHWSDHGKYALTANTLGCGVGSGRNLGEESSEVTRWVTAKVIGTSNLSFIESYCVLATLWGSEGLPSWQHHGVDSVVPPVIEEGKNLPTVAQLVWGGVSRSFSRAPVALMSFLTWRWDLGSQLCPPSPMSPAVSRPADSGKNMWVVLVKHVPLFLEKPLSQTRAGAASSTPDYRSWHSRAPTLGANCRKGSFEPVWHSNHHYIRDSVAALSPREV
jgi:hypothetical protein